jgi:hypothetical protein
LQLNLASLSRHPDFVSELKLASGLPAGLRQTRTPYGQVGWLDVQDAFRFAVTLRHPRLMPDESTSVLPRDESTHR